MWKFKVSRRTQKIIRPQKHKFLLKIKKKGNLLTRSEKSSIIIYSERKSHLYNTFIMLWNARNFPFSDDLLHPFYIGYINEFLAFTIAWMRRKWVRTSLGNPKFFLYWKINKHHVIKNVWIIKMKKKICIGFGWTALFKIKKCWKWK